jgi:Uma2 family endonuclease
MTILLTADEYLATGDERPRFTELVNGDVIVNSPNLRHQLLMTRIQFLINLWCERGEDRGIAPHSIDVKLDSGNVFTADVMWLSSKRLPKTNVANLVGPPDLAVEVRSPSTWRYDIGTKKDTYERAGLPELWLVDSAANTVLVYRRRSIESPSFDIALELGEGEQLTTPLLPEFSLDITALFAYANRSES